MPCRNGGIVDSFRYRVCCRIRPNGLVLRPCSRSFSLVQMLEVAAERRAGDAEVRGHGSLVAVHGLADPPDVIPYRAGQCEILLAGWFSRVQFRWRGSSQQFRLELDMF